MQGFISNEIDFSLNNIVNTEMELPNRKSRDEDEYSIEETNDVRSSLQGPLREGGPREEDAGFLGGGGPTTSGSYYSLPHTLFLLTALFFAAC